MKRVLSIVVGILSWSTLAHAADAPPRPWYADRLIGMEVGPTGAQFGSDPRDAEYCVRFNGAEVVRQQVEIGSQYVVIWGRDGEWAYYNSKIAPKCPGMGNRDIIQETVDAAKPHGLPVIVYCVVQAGGYAMREHPDWQMKDCDGKSIGRMCLNSAYLGMIEDLTTEMLAYGIDGFHIDMLDQGFGPPYGCWCERCRALFEKEYGQPMPTGVTWDAAWDRMLEFRYNTSARFETALRTFIREKAPRVSVDFNYHGYPPFSFEVGQRPVQHAVVGDFVTCESGVWGFSALGAGLTAQFVRAATPGKVYQVVMQRGVRFYHDQTARPLNDLRWEMFALLANNAQVTIVDKTNSAGDMDPVSYGRIKDVFAEVLAKKAHFGQPLWQEAALYYSSRSRDWYGREKKEKYQDAFFGAHKALVYAHIPCGVLLDESCTLEAMKAFPVIVFPGVTILSPKEVENIKAYVEAGGKAVFTGLSGMYGPLGEQLKESALAELIGARVQGTIEDADNYVRFAGPCAALPGLTRDVPAKWPHLVYGPATIYEPAGAEAVGELLRGERRWMQKEGKEGTSFPSSPAGVVGPALLIHHVGQGTVLTLAAAPDAASASEYRSTEARILLSNAVRALKPDPEIRIDVPKHVETVVSKDPSSGITRIHFVACMAPPSITTIKRPFVIPELIEDRPLYRATVYCKTPAAACRALNPSTEVRQNGNEVHLTIEDIHEVVLIEPDKPAGGTESAASGGPQPKR